MDPSIEGFAVISGSRILLPVEVSSIDASVAIGAIGTIGTIQFANVTVGTIQIGTVQLVVETDYIGTLGTIQHGYIEQVADVGTLGTLQAGNITASISGGVLQDVGTLGTLQAGNVTASVSGGQLQDVATVGTILSPMAVVGTVQSQPAAYVFTSVSATIRGSPGVLYRVNASGESGLVSGPGTLLVLDSTSTIAVIPVAAAGFVSAPFTPGVSFGTLIGSVIGSVDATFVVK